MVSGGGVVDRVRMRLVLARDPGFPFSPTRISLNPPDLTPVLEAATKPDPAAIKSLVYPPAERRIFAGQHLKKGRIC